MSRPEVGSIKVLLGIVISTPCINGSSYRIYTLDIFTEGSYA